MSSAGEMIGLTVRQLILRHNVNRPAGFRIYRLQGQEDTVGRLIVEDYTIQSACDRVPTIAGARIIMAEDYYGQIILRVRSVRK